ncbi:hypothetical protein TrRE_jg1027, partial [Triparma retinervis]
MCGIFAIFNSTLSEAELRKLMITCSSTLRHRGPDWSGYNMLPSPDGKTFSGMAHERLAIMDPDSGAQPFTSKDGNITIAANGEIYNYKELYASEAKEYEPQTGSDCEILLPLFAKYGSTPPLADKLRGMFSFVLHDASTNTFTAVRDHVGITPLYIGYGNDGSIWFSSEMKAIVKHCVSLQQFPPGHMFVNGEFVRWYKPKYIVSETPIGGPLPTTPYNASALREAFTNSVIRRMMSDVPWGVLLSGGLDSSLVASIASRHIKRKVFGGYLYFHKCPNKREFQEETVDKLSRLYMYDCLRCNKSMSAWGVEPRVPFLDADFLDLAMSLDPKEKMIHTKNVKPEDKRIEKWAVRKAFDTPDDPYLPDEILWRQKEQFSDGVGYGWVDSLRDAAEAEVSDILFAQASKRFPHNTP